MTNATALTINELDRNAFSAQPAGDVFDTGADAVTVYGTVDTQKSGRLIAEITNHGTAALVVTALAGDYPPSHLAGQGSVQQSIGVGSAWVFGPWESARFTQDDGTFGLTLTPDGTIAGTVRVYALPNI